ncbi:uncharacterized protein LOC141631377 [Silene latifolia]|uniref:uncharacterized protein LOC141631377 n=1 Tax=Silene latifolia TaxID=37657 RepID=UPI003D782A5A
MVGCWAIWERRNKAIFEDGEWRADWVVNRTRELMGEMMNEVEGRSLRGTGRYGVGIENRVDEVGEGGGRRQQWEKPMYGVLKVNVDAGLMRGKGVGWGVVCRNSYGQITCCTAIQEKEERSPKYAEAMAVFHGVQEARSMGARNIIIESDCLEVVENLKMGNEGRSDIHLVYLDIFSICSFFDSVVFSFTRRYFNMVAHSVAHYYPWSLGRRVW